MAIVKQWEAFPIGPKGDFGDLHVTMGRKGDILIGARAYEKHGQPEAAILLFDRGNQLIGLRPTNVHSGNTYPFQPKPGSKHRIIRANRFCRHYGIRTDHLIAFINPVIDRDGTLVLDLRATRRIGKSADLDKCS